jgi:hypothetical protein
MRLGTPARSFFRSVLTGCGHACRAHFLFQEVDERIVLGVRR